MASVFHLFLSASHVTHTIIRESTRLEGPTRVRHFAALKIQRLFRGYRVRKEISMWHEKATLIQKHVRGWLLRWHLPEIMTDYLYEIRTKHYHKMATTVQALWRGYKVRKSMDMSVSDMLRRKSEMKHANDDMQMKLRELFEAMRAGKNGLGVSPEEEERLKQECKQWVLYILFKTHHLLRTNMREGVCSKHNERELSDIERWMKSLPMKSYMSELRKIYNSKAGQNTFKYIFEDKKYQKLEDEYALIEQNLPNEIIEDEPEDLCKKSFDLYKKPKQKEYERLMLYQEKYLPGFRPDLRTFSKHSVDFDLFVKKLVEAKPDVPPYHINFWQSEKCAIHYPSCFCQKL